jgi:hypothetical protein
LLAQRVLLSQIENHSNPTADTFTDKIDTFRKRSVTNPNPPELPLRSSCFSLVWLSEFFAFSLIFA